MAQMTTISGGAGQAPLRFKKNALHSQLGVPAGQPIPAAKKRAALSGQYGPLAKKRANFAFKGALAAGRRSALANAAAGK